MKNQKTKTKSIKHDGTLTISVGSSRKEINWKNKEILWSELIIKLSKTTRTHETFTEYKKLPKSQQGQIKDVGGFVGGTLKSGRRKSDNVVWRQLLTLDVDFVKGDLWTSIELFCDFSCVMYSTHSHSPQSQRLRLVIPLKRPITPDEYPAVSRYVASDIGIDMFDDTTYEPHRLMYWPSTSSDGEYVFEYQDAKWLDPDEVLGRYPDWKDPSYLPESSRTQKKRQRLAEKQGDPLTKQGWVGAFCRTYSIPEAIETFLNDIYGPVGDGRYTYLPGSTAGGLVVYDGDTFAYSHHGTDPVSGKLVNSFDLVRLHKFGVQDEDSELGTPTVKLPSYTSMNAFVAEDAQVQDTKREERMAAIEEDFKEGSVNPKKLFFEEKKFIPSYMGDWFLKRHRAFVMNDDLYVYKNGVYAKGERLFHEESTNALGVEFSTGRIKEAIAYIKNTVSNVLPKDATINGDFLNVQNGLLKLDTFELVPHTHELLTIVQLPVSYDPKADCTVIDTFLHSVVPKGCIPIIEEMAGYCLIPTMKYEKALLLIGEGGNGKGTLIALLTSLLGEQNVAGVSFQDLSENRFASAELFGKMANLHADIPNKTLENSSRFKELVSGDMIRAEEKHKQPFNFRNRAKLVFSANELPTSRDNTDGFHRRLLITPFPNKFTDRKLRQRLFAPENLSGFLLRALQGLARLQKQGRFSESESVKKALVEYRESGDTVFRFLKEHCILDPEAMTSKQEVYDAYRDMCFRWGNQPSSQSKFNARLRAIHPEITEYRKTPPRKWRGVKLENTSEFLG